MSKPGIASVRPKRISTEIPGLDDILGGGLPANRLYVVQGAPGVGKTTLALQFLLAGVRAGESVLYITLSETEEEVREIADSHGWSIDRLNLFELSGAEQVLRLEQENSLYATSEVELQETVRVLLAEVERTNPSRVVFDSLSEIRLLSQSAARHRRQLLSLKQYFSGRRCTVLLLDDLTGQGGDAQIESLAHGVISLEQAPSNYGADRRRLRVKKLRGCSFRSGYHDYVVKSGGIQVFPRLVAAEHRSAAQAKLLPTGIAQLDTLLGGGLDLATTTLLLGPAGSGKSLVATQFACAAPAAGLKAAMFLFEERVSTLQRRSRGVGLPLDAAVAAGTIELHQIDPAELAPDELTHLVRAAVDERGARVVVIDSVNGYYASIPDAHFISLLLHELLSYLGSQGVATIVTVAQSGMIGQMTAPIDMSYLADNVLLLRYFEASGRVRKAISMVKRRSGEHEDSIRELSISSAGIVVGDPLTAFRGVLTGVPVYEGKQETLSQEGEHGGA